MSFNRLIYDGCAYNKNLKEQEGTFWHHMDKSRFNLPANLQQQHNLKGIIQGNPVGTYDRPNGHLVAIENDLFGLTRTRTNCPSKKYHPAKQCPNGNCHLLDRFGHCLQCVKHTNTHVNRNTEKPLINYHKKVNFKTCTSDKCF